MTTTIGYAGLSHLGIVSSVATASRGYPVIGYDPDSAICSSLSNGNLPIVEPNLLQTLRASRDRIRFTDDARALKECDLVFLSLDVPTYPDQRSDLSALHQLVQQIVAEASPGATLIVHSQVPPGFTRKLSDTINHVRETNGYRVFYQVETLILGQAVDRALHPERLIVGRHDSAVALPAAYAEWLHSFHCPVLLMRYESAELAKVSINMFLASSVGTTNTLANLCEVVGADWAEIIPALQSDRRIGPHAYLKPGLGISGGNLERDLATVSELAREYGTEAGIVDALLSNSLNRRDWVFKTIHAEVIARCGSPVIAMWGLAYKPDTASTTNSPALSLIEALRPFGVRAYDPQAVLDACGWPHLVLVKTPLDACRGADALAVLTPWPEFSGIDVAQLAKLMRGRVIIDPFGALNGARCAELGFYYYRLGAPATAPEPAP